ncbi:Major intracellular serine protease [Escovopsis weberi]|uniref:Major intracellular serine protease n=1 Tax=Escovopsis weberi TaxID=150374 RepID=A0A0M8N5W1_ESCWE|nr:Major intracellular serine protease [Escovopsis weberi]
MLAKRDSDGRTPLHIAVEFERCQTQTQIGIVMALLKRRPAALDEEYDHEGLREDFHARFNHIQLYPLLKYVSFPNLKWTETKTVPGPRGRKKPAPKKTLKGMEIAFQWLRDKGVRRILNVVVEDFEPPSHSDEALEGALKDFGVEELDWRRLDIDPASLKKIGGCLHQFCQIEPEKLICFSSLQIPPVKVALIDDGVDFSGIKTMNRLLGRSFYYEGEGGTGKTRPYWNSTIGHGTLMARMILRICPAAVIHVIRLRSFVAKGSDSVQIDQHSAVNAIKYASELPDVQIISMSWTMPAPKMQGLKKVFDDAMALAAKKNILVFCAANDQGFHQDSTYPHSSNRSRFRIGAATPEGKGTDAVGNTEKIDYLLPGHNIPVDEPSPQHRQGSPVPEAIGTSSGSSIATALAAGLAALLLECVRLGILYTKETDSEPADRPFVIREDDWRRLRQRDGMREAFSNIGTSADSGNKYVEVERLFQDNAERLEDVRGDPINMLRVVAGIAGKLLGKAPQRSAHGDGSCVS